MKVKVVHSGDSDQLERRINEHIEKNADFFVKDIKFSSSVNSNYNKFTAIIIFEENRLQAVRTETNNELQKIHEILKEAGFNDVGQIVDFYKQSTKDKLTLKERVDKAYRCAWDADIPSPTVPEYRELHKAMTDIMNILKGEG